MRAISRWSTVVCLLCSRLLSTPAERILRNRDRDTLASKKAKFVAIVVPEFVCTIAGIGIRRSITQIKQDLEWQKMTCPVESSQVYRFSSSKPPPHLSQSGTPAPSNKYNAFHQSLPSYRRLLTPTSSGVGLLPVYSSSHLNSVFWYTAFLCRLL